jgi:predicted MFS family arabinose efflux permease
LVFGAVLGLLWLSTVPLTSGLIGTVFGPAYMSMLFGVVFFSHQIGSFFGAWLGGKLYDMLGSYDAMWWITVALGLAAAALHWPIAERPVARLASAAGVAQ